MQQKWLLLSNVGRKGNTVHEVAATFLFLFCILYLSKSFSYHDGNTQTEPVVPLGGRVHQHLVVFT